MNSGAELDIIAARMEGATPLSMIDHSFHWAITLPEPFVIIGFVVLFVVIMLGWAFFLSWLDRRHDESWDDGYHSGYARGRRDERAELGIVVPHMSVGEAHYPMIVETLPDGSQRRLDR